MEIQLKENEEINDLEYKRREFSEDSSKLVTDVEHKEEYSRNNNWRIIQNKKEFCFGIDSVLLSDFAKDIKVGSKVLDLGTGTGILAILLSGKTKLSNIIGIEIQEQVYDMAKRSIKLNNLENKVQIINEDIKNLSNLFERQSIDAIVTNPPYKKNNTGIKNENEAKLISRHEIKCNLEDIIKQSSIVLKDNGQLYMVHRPERLTDILFYLRKYKIEAKSIRFVYSKENHPPKLILIKAIKNANPFLKIEKPLIIYKDNGEYTDEILKIYDK